METPPAHAYGVNRSNRCGSRRQTREKRNHPEQAPRPTWRVVSPVFANPDEGIQARRRSVLAAIDYLLEKAGTSKANLLRADICLTDMANFAFMNQLRAE